MQRYKQYPKQPNSNNGPFLNNSKNFMENFFNTHLFKNNPYHSAETHYFKSTNIGVEIEYTTVEYEK